MKNIIKSLFVAVMAMSVTFAFAQGPAKTEKKAPAKMEKKEGKMEKKETKMEKKETKVEKKGAKKDPK